MKTEQKKLTIPKSKRKEFKSALGNIRKFEKKYKGFIPKKYKVIDSNIDGWDSFDPSCKNL